jgi:DNA-binding transcriptional regulator YhcF (GntR family)
MTINVSSRVPKHMQTAILLKRRITKGDYLPDAQIPSVRMLGAELGVSQNVVQRAIQLLEKEGIVEAQRGIGVRVLAQNKSQRVPLTFGMVIPYGPNERFAGAIHCHTENALDITKNYCIIKSSCHDIERERRLIETFVKVGIEGLVVWPCEGVKNVDFLNNVALKRPLVMVDCSPDGVDAPAVVLDFSGVGQDIITYLASQGFKKILILEDNLCISSYKEMYSSMRQTVQMIGAQEKFHFALMQTTTFLEAYQKNPQTEVKKYAAFLETEMRQHDYEALYCPQAAFLDFVFVNTELSAKYPFLKLFTISNTLPSPRSLAYYDRQPREWIGDYGQMIRKASQILHDMVYLRIRPTRQYRIKFKTNYTKRKEE